MAATAARFSSVFSEQPLTPAASVVSLLRGCQYLTPCSSQAPPAMRHALCVLVRKGDTAVSSRFRERQNPATFL